MRSSRMRVAALSAALLLCTGCGDAVYEMTAEEEALIVNYAAQTVAKFNTYQQDGEVFVRTDILENGGLQEETEEQEPEAEATEAVTDTEEPSDAKQPQGADTPIQEPEGAQEAGTTMGAALELGAVSADYQGYELCGTYQEEDYYAVDAEAGKQFLVLKYNLANSSGETVHVDILGKAPVFSVIVNGEQKVPALTTILLNDLSTYQSDLEANETKETVLLFQVPGDMTDISGLQLNVTVNGTNQRINL